MKVELNYFVRHSYGGVHAAFLIPQDAFAWVEQNQTWSAGYVVVNIDGHPVNRMGAIL